MTKGQIRIAVMKAADAYGNAKWDMTAGGEVDQKIGAAHMRGFKRILNARNTYRAAVRSCAVSSLGVVAMTALNSGTGNSAQTFYRVLNVRSGDMVYRELQGDAASLVIADHYPEGVWFPFGADLYIPGAKNGTARIAVNYTPTRIDNLAADGDTFDWPADHEQALINDAAADVLMKGGEETAGATALRLLADDYFAQMLSDIARFSTAPMRVKYADSASDFGGW